MPEYKQIFENNKKWAADKKASEADFFQKLAQGQDPEYLYIGCSDSRVAAEEITGLKPGEMFVHRNIANLVSNNDLNVMSVINYAVITLNVKHIIVCGHYGCGGIKAAMEHEDLGLLNPWLRNIRDVYRLHAEELEATQEAEQKYRRLVEINVIEQCINVLKTAAVQKAYLVNKQPMVHGWVFDMSTGLLTDLNFNHDEQLSAIRKIYDLGTTR